MTYRNMNTNKKPKNLKDLIKVWLSKILCQIQYRIMDANVVDIVDPASRPYCRVHSWGPLMIEPLRPVVVEDEQETLRKSLEQAVAAQDYERAAIIWDQINKEEDGTNRED